MEYPQRYHPMEGTKQFLIWGVFYDLSCQEVILEEKILVCTINDIRKIREVKGREEISS